MRVMSSETREHIQTVTTRFLDHHHQVYNIALRPDVRNNKNEELSMSNENLVAGYLDCDLPKVWNNLDPGDCLEHCQWSPGTFEDATLRFLISALFR